MPIPLSQVPRTWAGDVRLEPGDLRAVTPNDSIPGIPFMFRAAFVDAAGAVVQTFSLPFAWKFIDALVIKRGATSATAGTVTITQAGNALTETLTTQLTLGDSRPNLSNFAPFDDFNANAVMTVTNTKVAAGNAAVLVWIRGVRTG